MLGFTNHIDQSAQRIIAVAGLSPVAVGVNDNFTRKRHPAARHFAQFPFYPIGQVRRIRGIKAQLNGAGHFIHILTAGAGGAHKALLNLGLIK